MIKWHNYPEEEPKWNTYLCKLADDEYRELTYDDVWGWIADIDDYDQPHFIYDWYLQYAEDTPSNRREWEKLKQEAEYEEKDYDDYDAIFASCGGWLDDDYDDEPWDSEDDTTRQLKTDKIRLRITDVVPFINERRSGFIIEWASDIGYGEYTIYKPADSDEWRGDSEYMDNNEDKDFIRELMKLFINKLIVE
jgi:hypothetical protein